MNVNSAAALFCMVVLQIMATRRQHFFMHTPFQFFLIISLLYYFGMELMSDLAFVSGVQDLDSVIHSHLSVLFVVLFRI